MKITETTLRLVGITPMVLDLLKRDGILPFELADLPLLNIHDLNMLRPVLEKAKYDNDGNILEFTAGGGDAETVTRFTHNAQNIVSKMEFNHGVVITCVYRPNGLLLQESVIDSKGNRTLRGEFIYHQTHRDTLAKVIQYPVEQEVEELGKDEEGKPQYSITMKASEENKPTIQTSVINEEGLVISTSDIDGIKHYEYEPGTTMFKKIIEQMTSGFDENETLRRVTENEFDEHGLMTASKMYIDPNNPIQKATFRNEYDAKGRFVAMYRTDGDLQAEEKTIDFSKYWEKVDAA